MAFVLSLKKHSLLNDALKFSSCLLILPFLVAYPEPKKSVSRPKYQPRGLPADLDPQTGAGMEARPTSPQMSDQRCHLQPRRAQGAGTISGSENRALASEAHLHGC